MGEEEKIVRARKQLVAVGVVCVSVVVLILWIINLRSLFSYNRTNASDTLAPLKNTRPLNSTWEQFKSQLDNLKK